MSQLCCPVCWELLDVLRGTGKDLNVRGRHPTILPVQLPPWLPRNVMEEMVARFESFLLQDITSMMQEPAKRHPSHPFLPSSTIASHEYDYAVEIGFPSILPPS